MLASLKEIKWETQLTFSSLGSLWSSLFSFNKDKIDGAMNKLSWPVGAVKFGDTLLQIGWWKLFLAFAGMISLALAIFNVLPIPALDGGRILWVLIQWIGKLKPEKYFDIEGYINLVFFVALMWLWVFIILKDLVRFWWVHIPFLS
jgi:regulator of sigma E protease